MPLGLTASNALRQLVGFARGRYPGQLIVQLTDACNARCPQCGMRTTNHYPRSRLDPTTARRIIDAAASRGVSALSFTGGEPFLYQQDLVELVRYAVSRGIPLTRTGTNGFMFMGADRPDFDQRIGRLARSLKRAGLYTLWISLDSWDPERHERLRGLPGVVEGVRRALPIFHAAGLYPAANLGINRQVAAGDGLDLYHQMLEGFRRFYRRVIGLGFTMANACYPMSLDPQHPALEAVYAATSPARLVQFDSGERTQVFRALMQAVGEFRPRIRIFSPRCSLYALAAQHDRAVGASRLSYPCRGGREFLFVDSRDGDTYPCGYRGRENLGKLWDLPPGDPDGTRPCHACDWECWRDPSQLLGPLVDLFSRPSRFATRWLRDREFMRLWREDLRYYAACDYFDGSLPPAHERLSAFQSSPAAT
jgi:MoaA/NifB/PqqE/SkfB family radical SAM enzyme